ncbi:hypothetical protein HispidOSU_009796, partial [Sigmodon hispidus]
TVCMEMSHKCLICTNVRNDTCDTEEVLTSPKSPKHEEQLREFEQITFNCIVYALSTTFLDD